MIAREMGKAWSFFRERGLKECLLSRETPFLIQFGKYGFCGLLSLVVFIIFVACAERFFPHYFATELAARELAWNTAILHFLAFIPANFVAYGLNRWLVFTPGRHSVKRELSLFTLISFISFALGEVLPFWLIQNFSLPRPLIHFSFIISSALINFICRKLFVFEN